MLKICLIIFFFIFLPSKTKFNMKKITLLFLALGLTSIVSAQCLNPNSGTWPADPFIPSNCNGYTSNPIVTDGFTDEYSIVTVTSGQTYTFSSSITTDVVTISADSGLTAAAFGIGSVTWVATVTGDVWFYTNLNDGNCGGDFDTRTRAVVCGTPPSCMPVLSMSIPNLNGTTATIAWLASTSTPTNGYQYYFSTANTAPSVATTPSGSLAAGVTSANLTGLTIQTTYYFWVRSVCNATSTSDWSSALSFTTPCSSTTVPYLEDFESASTPDIPSCTYTINNGLGNNWEVANSPSTSFSSNTLMYSYNNANPANTWFFTNGINLIAGTPYNVTYTYGNNSTFYSEKLKVACGTSLSVAAMTNVLFDHTSIIGDTSNTNTVSFTPTASGTYYFGFNAYSDADQYELYVDDISITQNLSNTTFATNAIPFYPNPVKDVLNLSYSKTISQVNVFNSIGQEVAVKSINKNQSQIDMSNLSKGAYLVKVTSSEGAIQTIKLLKD
jgi:hypothetical protein